MYQYAEEKLKDYLEKEKQKKKKKEQELNTIREKIDCVFSYDSLDNQLINNVFLAAGCIAAMGIFLSPGITVLIKSLFITLSVGLKVAVISSSLVGVLFLLAGVYYVKESNSTLKEKNALKQKGVKKFKKQMSELFDEKLKLEKEEVAIQSKVNKIEDILNHINFFRETVNIPFYQADTKEEYESKLKHDEKPNDDYIDTILSDKPKMRELRNGN